MYLIHVYPLMRGTPLQSLTYFSRTEYPRGSVISVPIRRKQTPAVVARVEPLDAARTKVRRADHAIAPIKAQEPRTLFLPAFLDAIERVALGSAGTPGAILHSMLPAPVTERLSVPLPEHAQSGAVHFEQLLLQAHRAERKSELRTLVREHFARKKSVLVIVPNPKETESYADMLGTGLEKDRAIIFHSALPPRHAREQWAYAARHPGPVLLITTPSGLGIPRNDLGIIVLEHENAEGYMREVRPHVDVHDAVEAYARALSIPNLLSGALLRMQSLYRLEQGKVAEYRPLRTRAHGSAKIKIVDTRAYKSNARGEYRALSDELVALVRRVESDTAQNGVRLFILSGRRGLASSVICNDCGASVQCAHCDAPVSLHSKKGENVFLCHHCHTMGDALARCSVCQSWKLIALGGGSELIEKQLKRGTSLPVYRIDSDSAKTPKLAAMIAHKAAEAPSILIGTELALPYLPDVLPHSAVAAIDSLLGISDFSLDERLFSLLLAVRERTEGTLIIQSRNPAHQTLAYAESGDIRGFQARELKARRAFGFPPYATLISIARFGPKFIVTKDVAALAGRLAAYKPTLLPAQRGTLRGSEIILQLPKEKWPDQTLLAHLRALPPHWDIRIRT